MKEWRLGDVSIINYGYTAKASHAKLGPRFLRITDIQNGVVDWNSVPTCMISQDEIEKHQLLDGDIVFARTGATTGKSYRIVGAPKAVPASYLIRVRVTKPNVDPRFVELFFQTRSYWAMVKRGTSGSAQGGFNASKLAELRIPLPPLPEQKRIVAILDEAFAGIATAVANTEKNLANARELFESYLNSVFSQRGEGWDKKCFGEISGFVRGPFGGSLKKACFVSNGYAVYEQQHAINNQFSTMRYFIDDTKFGDMSRFELRPNDLIMSCSGTMGRVAIAPHDLKRGIINQALLKLTPSHNLDSRYLKFWMESGDFIKEIAKHSKGAAIRNVASVKILKEIQVPLPALSEQQSIVAELVDCRELTDELVNLNQQKLNALTELKQSLLQKAFSGELTADKEAPNSILKEEEVA
jgi:type I restriction enzyme S subunit